jgi:hypothetical protein
MKTTIHAVPKSGTPSKKVKKAPEWTEYARGEAGANRYIPPPEIKEEEKTLFDHATDFHDFLKEAWRVADGVNRSIADRVSEFKGEDWEYELSLFVPLLKWWRFQQESFPVFVARKNLFAKIDLFLTKEYRAVTLQLEYQTSTLKSQIEQLELTRQKSELRPEILANPYPNPEKIKWLKSINRLGVLFQWLSQKGYIDTNWAVLAEAHFMKPNGESIGPNLPKLAGNKGKSLSDFSTSLEKELGKDMGSAPPD